MSLPLASRSAPLLVILDRDNKEDQQGDALDACQEEEVVVQRAAVDIAWKRENPSVIVLYNRIQSLRLAFK